MAEVPGKLFGWKMRVLLLDTIGYYLILADTGGGGVGGQVSGGGRLGVVVGGKMMRVDAGFCGLWPAIAPWRPAGSSSRRQVVSKCDSVTKPGFDQCLQAI